MRADHDRSERAGGVLEGHRRGPEGLGERGRELRHRTREGDIVGAAVLRSRRWVGVLRGRRDTGLDRTSCQRAKSSGPPRRSARRSTSRSATGRDGTRRARRVGPGDRRHGRRRAQAGKEDDLLHHGPEDVPEGRLPVEGDDDFPRRRDRGSLLQGAMPARERPPGVQEIPSPTAEISERAGPTQRSNVTGPDAGGAAKMAG